MMPRRFDLKMKGRHVVEKACLHEVIGIDTGFREVRGRTAEEASDGPHGLQEGRHAKVVE
jgi:hypothetical protein